MIICHELKLIFLKTKKVGGTSFEIALSKFCGPNCVITPISPKDEDTRAALSFPGPQNFKNTVWPDGTQSAGEFYNHIKAKDARNLIPLDIWNSYKVVTIVRDPFDAMISRFFWEKSLNLAPIDFGKFTHMYRRFLLENTDIAPLDGSNAPDVFLRYEHLESDISDLGVEGLWETFKDLKSKSGLRAQHGSSPEELYREFPKALDIVAEQCSDEIAKFAYEPPIPYNERFPLPDKIQKTDFIFTLSSGRSGTSWLSKFLGANLPHTSLHEPFGLDDFGTQMPEVSTMRKFNEIGMDRSVRNFWNQKFAALQAPYAESNHTLGKCGLIEALAENDIGKRSTVIVLRRDLVKQCVSHINRNDFQNVGLVWQFYLSPDYRNCIVSGAPFRPLGPLGYAMWYCYEMEARQAYYQIKYRDRINFIDVRLEDVTKRDGARRLLAALGCSIDPILPQKANANSIESPPELETEIAKFMQHLNLNTLDLARKYVQAGRDLAVPAIVRAA